MKNYFLYYPVAISAPFCKKVPSKHAGKLKHCSKTCIFFCGHGGCVYLWFLKFLQHCVERGWYLQTSVSLLCIPFRKVQVQQDSWCMCAWVCAYTCGCVCILFSFFLSSCHAVCWLCCSYSMCMNKKQILLGVTGVTSISNGFEVVFVCCISLNFLLRFETISSTKLLAIAR